MLPKGYRLPKQNLKSLFQQGKRVSCGNVKVVFQPSKNPISRFMIILRYGKMQNSVGRHRSLRLIRELLMQHNDHYKNQNDVVFMIYPDKESSSLKQTLDNLRSLLSQIFNF